MNITIGNKFNHITSFRNKGKSLLAFPSNYTIIDLETTGLNSSFDEIIEFSALKIRNDKIVDKYSTLIKPYKPIDTFITELTGISNDMVKNAPTIKDILKKIIKFIDDDVIIGHNINFDINFLYDNYKRLENKNLKNDYVDTLRLAKRLIPELSHHRLIDLIKYFNIDNVEFHRALIDCQSTLTIYLRLKKIVIEKYGNVNSFVENTRIRNKLKAEDIKANCENFDITHPLYNRNCVFTGTLEKYTRKDAMQKVVDLGGKVQDNINKETNFLIIGNIEYSSNIKGNKSNKMLKAEKLKLNGNDIEIITENTFYDLINNE